jgi:hypothetical protein
MKYKNKKTANTYLTLYYRNINNLDRNIYFQRETMRIIFIILNEEYQKSDI